MRKKNASLLIAGVSSLVGCLAVAGHTFAETGTATSSSTSGYSTNSQIGTELKSYLRTDLTPEEYQALGQSFAEIGKAMGSILNDSSLTVDQKVSKIVELHKANAELLATKYVDPAKVDAFRKTSEEKLAQMAEYIRKSLSGGTATTTPSSPSQTQDSSYWQAKKLEMQKKSSEMRAKKVAEMAAAGIDVSNITGDLLDGTKTEESAFWAAAKTAMNAHEIASRKAYLEKLKTQGVDVSSITEDVIADGTKFWTAVKNLQKSAAGSQNSGTPSSSGELKEFLRTDLTQEDYRAISALMAEAGKAIGTALNDKTLSVDDKVAKILEVQKANAEILATKYVDPAKVDAFRAKSEKKLAEMAEYIRKSLNSGTTTPPPAQSNGEQGKNRGNEGRERKKNNPNRTGSGTVETREPRVEQKANPLSPKLRKALETKLRAIPDDKKDEFYQRAKTVLGAQIEKAKSANKPKLVAKLEAVMAIVEDVLGPTDTEDSGIIDSIFNSGSTAQ